MNKAEDVLKSYRVSNLPMYVVGAFDNGVTVFNQQIRAMNLVWALIESDVFLNDSETQEHCNCWCRIFWINGGCRTAREAH